MSGGGGGLGNPRKERAESGKAGGGGKLGAATGGEGGLEARVGLGEVAAGGFAADGRPGGAVAARTACLETVPSSDGRGMQVIEVGRYLNSR